MDNVSSVLESAPSTVRRIPVAMIRESTTALRPVDRKGEGFLSMLESIRRDGVLENISVRECVDPETGHAFYGLINGLHRVTCCRDLGIEFIDARVIAASDYEVQRIQVISNIQRVTTKPSEYSQALSRMLNADLSMTVTKLAAEIGKTPSFIYERLGLLKLNESVSKLVDSGDICVANGIALSRLDPKDQLDYLDRAQVTPFSEFSPVIAARLEQIKAANAKGKNAGPAVFVPVARAPKVAELKQELETNQAWAALNAKLSVTDPKTAFELGLKWAMKLDPISVEAAEALDKQHAAERAAAAKKREDERKAAKAKEDAEKLAKLPA